MKSKGPCNVTIFRFDSNGTQLRAIRIRGTSYGASRHIERWTKRGCSAVSVYVSSASTGKMVEVATFKQEKP